MPWLKLTIATTAEQAERLGDLLLQFDAASSSFHAATDEALFDEPSAPAGYWQRTYVSALLDSEIDLDILLACVRKRIGTDNIFSHKVEPLKEKNWTQAHQQGHGPLVFAGRLCICPSWCKPPQADLPSIILDPGLAFGSGTHASTALCLGWLARQDLINKRVIDYGCGSGILGLAAARLGARRVYGIDIDPQALAASLGNAQQNHLQDKIELATADEAEVPVADLLIANILLRPLLDLAPRFAALVRTGGALALSGILAVQTEECSAAYSPWFEMDEPSYQDEWALISAVRK